MRLKRRNLIVQVYHELLLLERQNSLQFVAQVPVLGLLDKSRGESIVKALSYLLLEDLVAAMDNDEWTWAG